MTASGYEGENYARATSSFSGPGADGNASQTTSAFT